MTNQIFKEKDLPMDDLKSLGLYSGDRLDMDKENLEALLAGRRTDMITFHNLKTEGFRIEQLDARLSLSREPDGTLSLSVHPVYKEAQQHDQLVNREVEQLKSGEVGSIGKTYKDSAGNEKIIVIEYDNKTREFVSYNPEKVRPPDQVNGQTLSAEQKALFRKGRVIELPDGTQIQFRAAEHKGLLSNRTGLVLSVLLDGGMSYLLITGIRNLFGQKSKQLTPFTKGYHQALKDMQVHRHGEPNEKQFQEPASNRPKQLRRGYKRGYSR